MQNANLRRRLAKISTPPPAAVAARARGQGPAVDGLAMWARRLAVYDAEDPRVGKKTGGLRATPSSRGVDPGTGKCAVTGVPKLLGVARCSATGLYTYFAADGLQAEGAPRRAEPVLLREVVRRLQKAGRDDAARHRGLARVARQRARGGPRVRAAGVSKEGTEWKPVRPACESWVVNRHMKLALTLMRRLAKGTEEGLTMRAVEERVAKCAAAEKAQDAARRARAQKSVDDDAATERRRCGAAVESARSSGRPSGDGRASGREDDGIGGE